MSSFEDLFSRAQKAESLLLNAPAFDGQRKVAKVISELVSALASAEKECLEQARIVGMGAEREGALRAQVERLQRMESMGTTMLGLAFRNGRVVVVGMATRETAHGKPIWLCQTDPPLGTKFMPVETEEEAKNWLRNTALAESFIAGSIT